MRFYHRLAGELVASVRDMGGFLEKVERMFAEVCGMLVGIGKQMKRVPEGGRTFTYMLIVRFE